jgi:hypothetical protein
MFDTGSTRYLIGSRRAKAKGGGNPMGGPGYHVAQFAYAFFRLPVFRGQRCSAPRLSYPVPRKPVR